MAAAPPTIFSARRRLAVARRAQARQREPGAARFALADMAEDVTERLAFIRHRPACALIVGEWSGALAASLREQGAEVTESDAGLDEERPYPFGGFDLIASLGTLGMVNDLPGALIHIRRALAPGGLAIASFPGAGSLPLLRRVLLEADGDRPAARIHPLVDVRGAGELLQRAGWADPVADSRTLTVAYRALGRLVADLRDQGLGNALASPAPLAAATLPRVEAAFAQAMDDDGRAIETFEILTLSGWRR